MKKTLSGLAFCAFALAACSSSAPAPVADYQIAPDTPQSRAFNAKFDRILLQNPQSREVVECNSYSLTGTGVFSAEVEECARALEKRGFVRVSAIPQFTAKDDEIAPNYPSRRFRDQDVTPRW